MTTGAPENWITQVRKGILELCLLNTLSTGPKYGYDIVRGLREVEGLVISEGTVYPILSRLKRERVLRTSIEESLQGPPRKYYSLTAAGRRLLTGMNLHWSKLTTSIAHLMEEEE